MNIIFVLFPCRVWLFFPTTEQGARNTGVLAGRARGLHQCILDDQTSISPVTRAARHGLRLLDGLWTLENSLFFILGDLCCLCVLAPSSTLSSSPRSLRSLR